MHSVLFLLVALMGVETVMAGVSRKNSVFPGKQLSMNGTSILGKTKPAKSIIHCSMKCLQDEDCVAANYEDGGVCHMSSGGHISLEESSNNTAILAPLEDSLHLVGLWPLQEAYEGKDISGHGNHIAMLDVTFPVDGVTPWASPAASFQGTTTSYGYIRNGQHLDVKSFSWMAKVYPNRAGTEYPEILLQWLDINGGTGVYIYLLNGHLRSCIYIPGCSSYCQSHQTALPVNTWHTLAVSFDLPTYTLTLWNGASQMFIRSPCGTGIKTSSQIYIGSRKGWNPYQGRLSCMSLFSSVVDYDVMRAATMQHCGGLH